jgi:hypothetical protein
VSSVLSAAIAPLLAVSFPLLAISVIAGHRQDRPFSADLPQDHDGRGALAVLRRDGVLFPFASFNRDTWRVTWPVMLRPSLEIPVTTSAIPKGWWGTRSPEQWRAYLMNGDEMFLGLDQPVTFPSYCGRSLGVRTTYRSTEPLPPVRVDPFPKDGLAVSGGVPVEPIETVSSTSAEWPALAVSLIDDFNRVEEQTIAGVRQHGGWRHPVPERARRTFPIRLESWYRSEAGEPGWTVSYVEAVRRYPALPEDKNCGLETLVSGWVHHRDGQLMDATQLNAKLTYCDRVGATYMLPLGRIRPKNQTYWVFQLSGWESEWYEVVSVRPKRVRYVLEVLAGAGRRCF